MASNVDRKSTTELSVGAGIAIAGVWLASAAVSIFIMMITFVWGDTSGPTNPSAGWLVLLLIATPMIAAYSITKKILDKDD